MVFKTFRELGEYWFKNSNTVVNKQVKSNLSKKEIDRMMRHNTQIGATPRFEYK